MMKNNILFVIIALIFSTRLHAVGIELVMKGPETNKTSWKKACPILARNFISSKRILKPAIADTYKCSVSVGKLSMNNPWKLYVDTNNEVDFKLYYFNKKTASINFTVGKHRISIS